MSKKWDDAGGPAAFQAQAEEWGRALLPLLYPGALVFMFAGTRMWHRLATGMEDAGFHLWDTLMWLHGQGFPKGQDISKLIDKANGEQRKIIGKKVRGDIASALANKIGYLADPANRNNKKCFGYGVEEISAPWTGHKTPQLKPAWEPILAFRAPSSGKKYAELALEFGSGALNVDGTRIGTDLVGWGGKGRVQGRTYEGGWGEAEARPVSGRFPANVALECTCEVVAVEVEAPTKVSSSHPHGVAYGKYGPSDYERGPGQIIRHTDPSCPAFMLDMEAGTTASRPSRFFYCAKASRSEREKGLGEAFARERRAGLVGADRDGPLDDVSERWRTAPTKNNHPTVKPIDLNRWLAKLLLPPSRVNPRRILVPFAGVGSEMIGAVLAGWDAVVGVEMNADYCRIAEARLAHWSEFRADLSLCNLN